MTAHTVSRPSTTFRVIHVVLLVIVWALGICLASTTIDAWNGDPDAAQSIAIGYGLALVYFLYVNTRDGVKAMRR